MNHIRGTIGHNRRKHIDFYVKAYVLYELCGEQKFQTETLPDILIRSGLSPNLINFTHMEIKTIDLKPLKKSYNIYFIFCIMLVVVCYLVVNNGIRIIYEPLLANKLKKIFLFGMIGLAFLFSYYQQKQKKKLNNIIEFEEKWNYYIKIFYLRLFWHILACGVTGFLLVLTGSNIFFYLALFDLFLMLIAFPNKLIVKKELNEDDIVFL